MIRQCQDCEKLTAFNEAQSSRLRVSHSSCHISDHSMRSWSLRSAHCWLHWTPTSVGALKAHILGVVEHSQRSRFTFE